MNAAHSLNILVSRKCVFDRLCTVYDTFHLGRSEKCEIVLPDPFVSRFHAKVSWKDKVAIVFDLNSRNVTRVNDVPIEGPKELSNGDVLQIGPFRCDVFYDIGSAFRAAADFSNETLMGNTIGENVEANRPVLTVAQQRVYEAFLQGLSEKEVAAQLGVSVHSVHNHTKSIYRAFNVNSRAQLLAHPPAATDFSDTEGGAEE